jgi:hypothetical protein
MKNVSFRWELQGGKKTGFIVIDLHPKYNSLVGNTFSVFLDYSKRE